MVCWAFVRKITPKIELTSKSILFFTALLNKQKNNLLSVLVRDVDCTFRNTIVRLPVKEEKIDFAFIDDFITMLEINRLDELKDNYSNEIEAYSNLINVK